jgi:hypothetical protein
LFTLGPLLSRFRHNQSALIMSIFFFFINILILIFHPWHEKKTVAHNWYVLHSTAALRKPSDYNASERFIFIFFFIYSQYICIIIFFLSLDYEVASGEEYAIMVFSNRNHNFMLYFFLQFAKKNYIFVIIISVKSKKQQKKMCCVSARRLSIHKTYNTF